MILHCSILCWWRGRGRKFGHAHQYTSTGKSVWLHGV